MAAHTLALLAALCFALGTVLQQRSTLETTADEGDPRFLRQILRRPVWLAGAGFQSAGWILQATALDRGSLIVVQSLTQLSLVLALPLGARLTGQQLSRRVWAGAFAMVAGVVLLLSAGSPQGGIDTPSREAWLAAGGSATVCIGVLVLLGRRRRGATRALMLGCAAGVSYAMQASVTKVFVTLVGSGVVTLLTSWTTYVLVTSALVGFALQQAALKTGVLAPAMGSANATTLFVSVLFGVTIFHETLAGGSGRVVGVIGLLIAIVGVSLLAGAEGPPAPDVATRPASTRA